MGHDLLVCKYKKLSFKALDKIINKCQQRVVFNNGCHVWVGSKTAEGYPRIRKGKEVFLIHRLVVIQKEKNYNFEVAMHSCDNPSCINPDHLRSGTNRQNSIDRDKKDRTLFAEKHPNSKLTNEQAKQINLRANSKERVVDLAKEYGVSKSVISAIKTKRAYRRGIDKHGPRFIPL